MGTAPFFRRKKGAVPFLSLLIAALFLSSPAEALLSKAKTKKSHQASERAAYKDRLDIANGLYARDMYEMAILEYESLLKDFPDASEVSTVSLRAAESLFFLKKYKDAIERYWEYVREYPDTPQSNTAHYRIGQALYHTGDGNAALLHFKGLLRHPDYKTWQTARYYSGKICFERGSDAAAKVHLNKVTMPHPESPYWPYANYYMGEIALREQAFSRADTYFKTAAGSDEILVKNTARFGEGKALYLMEKFQEAKEIFGELYQNTENGSELRSEAFLQYLQSMYAVGEDKAINGLYSSAPDELLPGPKRSLARLIAASGLLRLSKQTAAVSLYDEVIADEETLDEDREKAGLRRIEAFLDMKQYTRALEELEVFSENTPKAMDRVVFLRAKILTQLKSFDAALKELDRFLEEFGGSEFLEEAILNKGYLYLEMEKFSEARDVFKDYLGLFSSHPLYEKTLSDMILIDIKLEDDAAAIEDSLIFIEKFPGSSQSAKVHERLGSLYTDSKDYVKAIATYTAHLEKYTADVNEIQRIHFLMGYNEQLAGNFSKALEYFGRVSKEGSDSETYYAMLKSRAYVQIRQNDLEAAAEDYEIIVRDFPENDLKPEVFFWLASHYMKSGSGEDMKRLAMYLESRPDAGKYRSEIHYYTAEADRLQGNFDEAIVRYNKSIKKEGPYAADAYFGKALALKAQGELELAEESFENALRNLGEDHELAVSVRLEQSALYAEQEDYSRAAKGYFAVAILYDDPERVPEALIKAGEAFEKSGSNQEAIKAYEELIARYKKHPLAGKAKQKIKALKS